MADRLGDHVLETSLLLFSARAYREMGNKGRGDEMAARLRAKSAELAEAGIALRPRLTEEIEEELMEEAK